MKVTPLYGILRLLCFSDLSYPSLWSILNDSHQELNSGSFYGTSRGPQIVRHRFPSFSASSYLQTSCCSPNICRCLNLEKQQTVLQSRSFQGKSWTQQWGPCLRHKGEPCNLHTEYSAPAAYHSLLSVIFLCVSSAFPRVSSKSWSCSNTCRYCCALFGVQLAWLASTGFLLVSQRTFAFSSYHPRWLHGKYKYYPALFNSINHNTTPVLWLICFIRGLSWCLTHT